MTTSDLSGCCKPFGVSKAIAESVYEEFYKQAQTFNLYFKAKIVFLLLTIYDSIT